MKIHERFPGLSMDHLRSVAKEVVAQRNVVAELNKPLRLCTLGLAVLGCEATKVRFAQLELEGRTSWLRFLRGPGLAYVLVLGGVPLRIQPDCPEIRMTLPAERKALRELASGQGQLFEEPPSWEVLRLEVAQRPAQAVDALDLYLFNEATGETLDRIQVYSKAAGYIGDAAMMKRPAQTPSLDNVFKLRPSNDVKDSEA